MSRGINKVILVGNLGQDPETRNMPSGDAVTNISVATSEQWKDKKTGDQKERTEWHKVAFFGRLAEIAAEYLRKGSQVYVEGKLRTRKWQDRDGNDRWTTEVIADELQMLGGRPQQSEKQVKGSEAKSFKVASKKIVARRLVAPARQTVNAYCFAAAEVYIVLPARYNQFAPVVE